MGSSLKYSLILTILLYREIRCNFNNIYVEIILTILINLNGFPSSNARINTVSITFL